MKGFAFFAAILIMVTTHGYGALGDRALPREYIILHCFQGRAGSPSTPLQRRFAIIRIAGVFRVIFVFLVLKI